METEKLELIRYAMRFVVVLFLLSAVTLDLVCVFRFFRRDPMFGFARISVLKKRKLTFPVIALTLFTALIFTVPSHMQASTEDKMPELSGIVAGTLAYALSAAFLMICAAFHGRTRLGRLFHCSGCSYRKAISKGVIYGIAAIPPTMSVTVLTNALFVKAGLEAENQPVVQWLSNPSTTLLMYVVIFISAVIVAPVAEEVIFRGILFPAVLKNKSWVFSAMLTSCLFSLIHFHPPSFMSIFVLSLFFCAGYSATGSLLTPIFMHMVFNGAAIFCALLVSRC
ncbi:MAG: CPBP family intramembrane glutamic endopeptidase [Kiritimatiellia bacterium]